MKPKSQPCGMWGVSKLAVTMSGRPQQVTASPRPFFRAVGQISAAVAIIERRSMSRSHNWRGSSYSNSAP